MSLIFLNFLNFLKFPDSHQHNVGTFRSGAMFLTWCVPFHRKDLRNVDRTDMPLKYIIPSFSSNVLPHMLDPLPDIHAYITSLHMSI